jgi:hypothetical protein
MKPVQLAPEKNNTSSRVALALIFEPELLYQYETSCFPAVRPAHVLLALAVSFCGASTLRLAEALWNVDVSLAIVAPLEACHRHGKTEQVAERGSSKFQFGTTFVVAPATPTTIPAATAADPRAARNREPPIRL